MTTNAELDSSDTRGSYAYIDALKGVEYGPGSVQTALPKFLDLLHATRAFVVTGRSLYHKTDVVKTVEDVLKARSAHAATFCDIGEHAPVSGIKAGLEELKTSGADIVLSVGGGSPIDAAKAMIHFLEQAGGPRLKHIAIPTTLSAAEYTVGAGFVNEEGTKTGVYGPQLAPAGIILDAELTLATPERLWLSTGIRALDHAIENLYRAVVPIPLKYLCYGAIRDLFKYLPLSKADPRDLVARQRLQVAAWMSLWPLKTEKFSMLGLSHSLGRELGARYHMPHGITSCMTLSPVVALQADIASREHKEWLAGVLSYLQKPSTGSLEADICQLSVEIQRLVDELGLHSTLQQYQVPPGDVPQIARLTLRSGEDDPLLPRVVRILENL